MKKQSRVRKKLRLRRETIRRLDTEHLKQIVGAATQGQGCGGQGGSNECTFTCQEC